MEKRFILFKVQCKIHCVGKGSREFESFGHIMTAIKRTIKTWMLVVICFLYFRQVWIPGPENRPTIKLPNIFSHQWTQSDNPHTNMHTHHRPSNWHLLSQTSRIWKQAHILTLNLLHDIKEGMKLNNGSIRDYYFSVLTGIS